ncbi:site-specific integrase [Bradyrhizobium sp.]|uniref:tyrosine-type recombinase/integrase n=1 Tax=Bradyrhizobium sp. TaxID=376 RepID=UPI002D33BE39|nr:site-specific integrase [Bradyrhizobium sp.]HZR75674.1 site-specific integrase [Bradyrhizobium sp.]
MPLYLFQRNGIWNCRGTVAGRIIRRSLKTTDKTIAAREASQIEQREWKRRHDGPGSVLTFAQAAMHYRGGGKDDQWLSFIEDHLKDTLISEITPGYLRTLAVKILPGCSGATLNRKGLTSAIAVINYCAEDGLCSPIKVKRFKEDSKIKEPATLEWVNAFAANANPHVGALCMFMFMTGARIGEAIALQWNDLNLDDRTALIRQTKTGSDRLANLPPPLVAKLRLLSEMKIPDRGVFGYNGRGDLWRVWAAAIERAKIKHLSPHCCRHGFATGLLRRGVDVVTVAHLGGWKSPALVLKIYGHANRNRNITDLLAQNEHIATADSDNALKVVSDSE